MKDNNEMRQLNYEDLEMVSGGKAKDPYSGYPDSVRDYISPGVLSIVQAEALSCKSRSLDRDACGRAVHNRLNELCAVNEEQGFDYFIDFLYINLIIDKVYGII